jgi:hypothetical protein
MARRSVTPLIACLRIPALIWNSTRREARESSHRSSSVVVAPVWAPNSVDRTPVRPKRCPGSFDRERGYIFGKEHIPGSQACSSWRGHPGCRRPFGRSTSHESRRDRRRRPRPRSTSECHVQGRAGKRSRGARAPWRTHAQELHPRAAGRPRRRRALSIRPHPRPHHLPSPLESPVPGHDGHRARVVLGAPGNMTRRFWREMGALVQRWHVTWREGQGLA